MKKLNETIYNKLLLQGEEARERGMDKLASSIFEAIGSCPEDERKEYTYRELKEDVQRDLWKIAARVLAYYDLQSLDAEVLDKEIVSLAGHLVDDIELSLGVDEVIAGPLEPKLPGQDK